jgi:hypothetical protein
MPNTIDALMSEILHDRQAGTEDAWWHERVGDHLRDVGEYDDQDATDKRRIMRLPKVERQLIDAAAHRVLLADALRPFAEFCRQIDASPEGRDAPDGKVIHPGLTVGYFRRALAILRETDQ